MLLLCYIIIYMSTPNLTINTGQNSNTNNTLQRNNTNKLKIRTTPSPVAISSIQSTESANNVVQRLLKQLNDMASRTPTTYNMVQKIPNKPIDFFPHLSPNSRRKMSNEMSNKLAEMDNKLANNSTIQERQNNRVSWVQPLSERRHQKKERNNDNI
jgi:hypothetical protein